MGLRMSIFLARIGGFGTGVGVEQAESASGYLFIDVDPEHPSTNPAYGAEAYGLNRPTASQQACLALAAAKPERYTLEGRASASESVARSSTGVAAAKRIALSCDSSRPINRHLLAELIQTLSERGPRLIIVDVILAAELGFAREHIEESEALRRVILARSSSGSEAPLIFAEPVELAGRPDEVSGLVRMETARLIEPDSLRRVYSAIAFPAPGQPVRRYPKCFQMTSHKQIWTPSLPYLAARLLTTGRPRIDSLCAVATGSDALTEESSNAPRIVYSLPTSGAHEDDLQSPERARWALYHNLYNRCLAANIWNAERSRCATPALYRDKVIIIGASNPARRDRHYTPLGDMAGAEVILNAMRSFVLFPDNTDKRVMETLGTKLMLVLACSLVWFCYFLIRAWMTRYDRVLRPTRWQSTKRGFLLFSLFVMTTVAVCSVAVYGSFHNEGPVPSMDVLIPVLAVSIDVYVEQIAKVVHWIEHQLAALFGVQSDQDFTGH